MISWELGLFATFTGSIEVASSGKTGLISVESIGCMGHCLAIWPIPLQMKHVTESKDINILYETSSYGTTSEAGSSISLFGIIYICRRKLSTCAHSSPEIPARRNDMGEMAVLILKSPFLRYRAVSTGIRLIKSVVLRVL